MALAYLSAWQTAVNRSCAMATIMKTEPTWPTEVRGQRRCGKRAMCAREARPKCFLSEQRDPSFFGSRFSDYWLLLNSVYQNPTLLYPLL